MGVYFLSNPSFDEGVYKIGKTSDIEQRMKNLYSTNIPTRFNLELFFDNFEHDLDAEKWFHDRFKKNRINNSREFFRISEEEMFELIDLMPSHIIKCGDRWKDYWLECLREEEENGQKPDVNLCNHLTNKTPAEWVEITLNDGTVCAFGKDNDYYEIQVTNNALWVYDGKYTHNYLEMYPLDTIKHVVFQYSQQSCIDQEYSEGNVRLRLPEDLDMDRMENCYGY